MNSQTIPGKKVAIVLKGYPRLSETFIAQEIYELEKRGLDIILVSLRHPTDKKTHPVHNQIKAQVLYLPEYLRDEPLRVFKSWWKVRRFPGYKNAYRIWLKDFRRDRTHNRIRRFGQALVVAAELPAETEIYYAHFLHTPSSVTRYASMVTGTPWAASAHAKDIWTSATWDLEEKLVDLQWLTTCTRANLDYLQTLTKEPEKVHLVYHGLDFSRFPLQGSQQYSVNDGKTPETAVRLISVGRAVAKKGYDVLLDALALLPQDYHWQFTHIGGGKQLKALQEQAERLGLEEKISWLGAKPQDEVLAQYRLSDIFVLASKIIADGDRDGLPNVLMEAQSQGVCCLATNISGIPELIESDKNGVLVEPEQPQQLADALQELIARPAKREELGRAGYAMLKKNFDVTVGIDALMTLFTHDTAS